MKVLMFVILSTMAGASVTLVHHATDPTFPAVYAFTGGVTGYLIALAALVFALILKELRR